MGLPAEVPLPERCVGASAGHFHTLALGESGSVWAFGCNGKGQLVGGLGAAGWEACAGQGEAGRAARHWCLGCCCSCTLLAALPPHHPLQGLGKEIVLQREPRMVKALEGGWAGAGGLRVERWCGGGGHAMAELEGAWWLQVSSGQAEGTP